MTCKPIIVILCLAFIIHVCVLIHNKLNPDIPDIKHYKKDLKEIDFPLAFQICIHEKIYNDTKKFKDLGYFDLLSFFSGTSMFNDSIVGWTGHTENGSSMATVEGLRFDLIDFEFSIYSFKKFLVKFHTTGQMY